MDDVIVSFEATTIVRIARPQFANAVTPGLMNGLADLFAEIDARDDVRAVVITGTDRFFCAGADVQEQRRLVQELGLDGCMDYQSEIWMPSVQRAIGAIWNCGKPVVAAINGAATAGGLDLALCCDYRVAAPAVKLGESYIRLGLVTVAGGAFLLPLLASRGKANWMLLSGQTITGSEGHELGIIDELAENDALLATAIRRAEEMCAAPPLAIRRMKQVIRGPLQAFFETALVAGLQSNTELLSTPETRRKFMEIMNFHSKT